MTYIEANKTFTRDELRALAKVRNLRWYSYLMKIELAHRLFGVDAHINRGLCQLNQMRRYQTPIPNEPNQWNIINA